MEKRPRKECVSLSDFTIIELQTPNTLTRQKKPADLSAPGKQAHEHFNT